MTDNYHEPDQSETPERFTIPLHVAREGKPDQQGSDFSGITLEGVLLSLEVSDRPRASQLDEVALRCDSFERLKTLLRAELGEALTNERIPNDVVLRVELTPAEVSRLHVERKEVFAALVSLSQELDRPVGMDAGDYMSVHFDLETTSVEWRYALRK